MPSARPTSSCSASRRAVVLALAACAAATGCAGPFAGPRATGGTLHAVDDTGLPPSAITDGWAVALPPGEEAWGLLGDEPAEDGRIERPEVVDPDDVLAAGGAWQPLGRGGRFELPIQPGSWVLCYAPDGRATTGPPYGLRGCRVVDLEDGSQVAMTWGEGGFWAEVEG